MKAVRGGLGSPGSSRHIILIEVREPLGALTYTSIVELDPDNDVASVPRDLVAGQRCIVRGSDGITRMAVVVALDPARETARLILGRLATRSDVLAAGLAWRGRLDAQDAAAVLVCG